MFDFYRMVKVVNATALLMLLLLCFLKYCW